MSESEEGDIGSLKLLKALVTTLMVVMIVGFIVLIALLVTRLQSPTEMPLPADITLPDGVRAVAFTQAEHWYAVVTQNEEILVYDRATGEISQRIKLIQAD